MLIKSLVGVATLVLGASVPAVDAATEKNSGMHSFLTSLFISNIQ